MDQRAQPLSVVIGTSIVIVVSLTAISGCAVDPDAVAVYRGGIVTVTELDRRVLELPRAERDSLAGDPGAYEDLVREMVVDRLLLQEAREADAAEIEGLAALIGERQRRRVTDLCLQKKMPPPAEITEEAQRDFFDEHRDQFQRQGRRMVLNIFLRLETGGDREELRRKALDARRRVLGGEDFESVAREVSDSESRHKGGMVGWIGRGESPPELETLIFGLETGVPSEPVSTRDGFHLFYVETAIEEKRFSFEEIRQQIVQQLWAENQARAVDELIVGFEAPAGSFVPTHEELLDLLAMGDPEALILRVGDHEIRAAQFVRLLGEGSQGGGARGDLRIRGPMLLDTLWKREAIHQLCLSEDWLDDDELAAARLEIEERILIDARRATRLQGLIDIESERIEDFFQRNQSRYATSLRFNLRRLTVPAGSNASATMGNLERLDQEIGTGAESIQELAVGFGGSVDELGWKTLTELGALEPKIAHYAVSLEPGVLSSPFAVRNELVMLQLVERREPENRPLAEVFEQVRDDYLIQHQQEIYRELEAATLDAAGYRLIEERLEAMLQI